MSNSMIEESINQVPLPKKTQEEPERDPHLNSKEVKAMNNLQLEEAQDIIEKKILTRAEKKEEIIKLIHRATSSGDDETIRALLNHPPLAEFIDVDAKDEEGSSPLIYAACFGYYEVAKALVKSGASVDLQDKNGWPPLMWAMSNKHEDIVKLLLENGASPSARTTKGRTVMDIINHGLTNTNNVEKSAKLQEILSYNHNHRTHQSMASFSSFSYADYPDDDTLSVKSWAYTDPEGPEREYFKSTGDRNGQLEMLGNDLDELMNSENFGYNEDSLNELTNDEFVWDQCLPDQMFVFSSQHIPHIIGTVVTTMRPLHAKDQKSVPANVFFLCSRFAFYFSTPDLLEDLLKGGLRAISDCVKAHHSDGKYLAFWLANCSQLLYYLKKDTGLVGATVEFQLSLSELIHEIYQLLVRDTQVRLTPELELCILDCDSIPGLSDESKFKEKRKSFFSFGLGEDEDNLSSGRSSLRKKLSLRRRPTNAPSLSRKRYASPDLITDIFSKTLAMLQLYNVHPMLIHHILNQLVYFVTAELFNRILDTRKYCSRTRAMQIRMNVTVLEDWIRRNSSSPIVSNLTFHFKPLLHLLQLLQCFSAHRSLGEFLETLQTLDTLTPLQIQLVAETYRYESDEEPVPDEVIAHIQVVADQILERKRRSACAAKDGKSIVVVRDLDDEVTSRISRRVSFLNPEELPLPRSRSPSIGHSTEERPPLPVKSSLRTSKDRPSSPLSGNNLSVPKPTAESSQKPFFLHNEYSIFKDSNHLLPFSVPTQSDMTHGWSGSAGSPTFGGESSPDSPRSIPPQLSELYIPTIPENFVDLLDVNNATK